MKCKIIFFVTISVLSLLFLGGACERDRKGDPIWLEVRNNSKDTIIFSLQFNYPDTVLLNYSTELSMTDVNSADPYSESGFYEFSGWEWTLRNERKVDGLVCITYSLDTIRKYPFEQIQEDYNILKRYILSIDDLKAINWTIVYP